MVPAGWRCHMSLVEMTKELYSQLERHSYKGKIMSVEHLDELENDIKGCHKKGLFNKEFYQEDLKFFDFEIPRSLPEAKSLIVVAAFQPQIKISFVWNGESFPLIIPPTYSYATDRKVKGLLESLLQPEGYHLIESALPLKLLAVHSGLAKYGKNNVSYVNGLGSFYRLVAFFTDFPSLEDNWGELRTLERCDKCPACATACPTGAISSDRFLLYAERCITFHNERRREFPKWLDPTWHNSVVGCLHCQKCCPLNKDFVKMIEEGETFSHEETDLLLQATTGDRIPAETVRKLQRLDIIEYLDMLPRNLSVLLKKQ